MGEPDRQKTVFGYASVAFGVIFLAALLVLAVVYPEPTSSQQDTFRIVLALAAAGVGAMFSGVLFIELKPLPRTSVQAGGAIALFVVVYFFNPASRVTDEPVLDATVPDVLDMPRVEALSLIDAAGLVAAPICEEAPTEADPGTVYSTTPVAGKRVESGSEVRLYVNPPC